MVSPFSGDAVDYDRLAKNVAFQIEQGIDGLVPTGTTGESPTLTHEEHEKVVEKTVEAVGGKVRVVAGTGSNATAEALRLTRHAKNVGADGALMVNPYYNKPTQEGLYRHFMTVADAVEIPILLYNIPGRTGITLSPATIVRLAQHPNIVGVKEATGSLDIASEVAAETDRDSFVLLSGDDSMTLPLMSIGGSGVISVLSNIMPANIKALCAAATAGDFDKACDLHLKLFAMCKGLLTLATNPIPIKTAMKLLGTDTGELRLPLCEMDATQVAQLRKLLQQQKLL
jgi:4-hydroxy-tetrahydrodipicolinate synthase